MRKIRMISAVLFMLVLAFALYQASAAGQQKSSGKSDAVSASLERPAEKHFVPGEIIVKRKPGAAPMIAAESAGRLGIESEAQTTSGGEVVYHLAPALMGTLSAADKEDRTLAAVAEIQKLPDVEYAVPNYIYQPMDTTPNDARFGEQWHYFNNGTGAGQSPGGINLPQAWDITRGNSSVVVAVIDTGILPTHPDIAGSPNLIAGFDMISNPAVGNDGGGRDADPTDPGDAVATNECGLGFQARPNSWHGTHVAGTIGVLNTNNGIGVAGVNWNTKIQPVRVLGKCGGTILDIADAIRWAAGLPVPGVPTNTTPVKVINMSLGGSGACSGDPVSQNAINDAVARGVTVVVAAGNSAHDASLDTPASCNNVITVAASDFRGFLVTRYSNFGSAVEIMAPGGDVQRDDNGDGNPDGVLSTINPVDGTYAYYNGTSMASPHVAGVAALLLSCNAALTPAQVLARLQSSAQARNSIQCPMSCGAGLLDAKAAVVAACPAPLPPPTASVVLFPDNMSLRLRGTNRTKTVTATVTQAGAVVPGVTVNFVTADPSVATVSPSSAVTNAAGKAQATVEAQHPGNTKVRASAGGASAQSPVKVPLLSYAVLILLAMAAFVVFLWKRREEQAVSSHTMR